LHQTRRKNMPRPSRVDAPHRPSGFSLIEVLVAMAILMTAVGALTQVCLLAGVTGVRARQTTLLALAARQQLEQLRAQRWDADELQPSSPDTVSHDTRGYVEYLDESLRSLGGGPPAPEGAAISCRWSVVPLDRSPGPTVVIHVAAVSVNGGGAVHLASIRTGRAE
jgi:prepilin-type N-terminal cleavage/methylation domain-containing protein